MAFSLDLQVTHIRTPEYLVCILLGAIIKEMGGIFAGL